VFSALLNAQQGFLHAGVLGLRAKLSGAESAGFLFLGQRAAVKPASKSAITLLGSFHFGYPKLL